MRAADQLIDIGPDAGVNGGNLVFQGTWTDIQNLAGEENEELRILAGRIALEQGEPERALEFFQDAEAAGVPLAQLAPFRAEIAFLRPDYAVIPALLDSLPADLKKRPPFAALVKYWL